MTDQVESRVALVTGAARGIAKDHGRGLRGRGGAAGLSAAGGVNRLY